MDEPRTTTPGYRPQSPDTDEWAERLLFERWSKMEPWQKMDLVSQLCRATQRLHLVGLALRHPDADEEELKLRAACLRLGRATVEAVRGHPLPFED